MTSTDRPNVSYARLDATERRIVEARRLAHQVEELLVEAAKDPAVDAYALRIAQGLARSLIDQLAERSSSKSRVAASLAPALVSPSVAGPGGHARVA